MSEKTTDNKLPYTCTSAYDRTPARAASVPPAMNRNSATGAAAAKISRSARSAAMLMRVHTIISPLFFSPHAQKSLSTDAVSSDILYSDFIMKSFFLHIPAANYQHLAFSAFSFCLSSHS